MMKITPRGRAKIPYVPGSSRHPGMVARASTSWIPRPQGPGRWGIRLRAGLVPASRNGGSGFDILDTGNLRPRYVGN